MLFTGRVITISVPALATGPLFGTYYYGIAIQLTLRNIFQRQAGAGPEQSHAGTAILVEIFQFNIIELAGYQCNGIDLKVSG